MASDRFHQAFECHNRHLRQKTLIRAAVGLLSEAAAMELAGSQSWHRDIVEVMNRVVELNQKADNLLSHTVMSVAKCCPAPPEARP